MNTLPEVDEDFRWDAMKETRRMKEAAARDMRGKTFEEQKALYKEALEAIYGKAAVEALEQSRRGKKPAPQRVRPARKPELAFA